MFILVRNISYYGDRWSFRELLFSSCADLVTCTVVAFHQKSLLSVQQQNCAEMENRVEERGSLSSGRGSAVRNSQTKAGET